jgi:alkane 1-monooxygenase
MASLRYLAPFAFLALVPLGAWLGGAWTFAAAIAIALGLAFLDAAFGKESLSAEESASPALRGLPAIYIVLQLAITAWTAFRIADGRTSLLEAAGLTLSDGLATGVFGFSAAHEMIHRRSRSGRALGLTFLASTFYMHFRISHLYGHHRRAATYEDPASARLGESLYAFLYRSLAGQVREAWDYEARRQRRAGRPVIGLRNRMVTFLAVELSILVAIAVASGAALAFILLNAALAIVLLETFNYVAHYGLSRDSGADGSAGPLGPEHSWNSGNRMNNSALFNMGRHSDHHRHNAHSYPQLKPMPAAPELPAGYAAAMLTALLPSLWRRTMDPRAMASRR